MASEQEKVAPPTEAPALAVLPPETPAPEQEKGAPPPEAPPPKVTPIGYLVVVEVVLRVLLFAATLTAVVVMVTSKQTELIFGLVRYSSKFTDSPAFIYYVAALSVAGLFSIITTLLSGLTLLKPGSYKQLVSHVVVVDVLLLGIVASAIGAAGGVGYIGFKGNSHALWNKVCNTYDTFCIHLAGSIAAALFASIVLVLLILLSFFTLSRKIPK